MNQGVIKSLKARYRKNIVQQFIRSLKKNKALPAISNFNYKKNNQKCNHC